MNEQFESEFEDVETSKVYGFIEGLTTKITSRDFRNQVLWSIGSVLLALVVAAVIMQMGGYDPGAAFVWLAVGAISQFDQVLWYASPLILAGLSVALAFRCGLFNIGAEGQLYIGAMASALAAYLVALPIVIHPLFCLTIGVLAGAAWGFVPGLLKAYRGAHEVVTTMMLSYSAVLFTSWLVGPNGPFWDGSMVSQTPQFRDTAVLPILWGNYLHFGFIIAMFMVVAVDYLINRTVLGYELRAVGYNTDAAEFAGINSKKNVAIALGISGGLSGLAGSTEILGTYDRFIANWSSGIGWDGITVAVLGNNNPWGVLAGGIFFGALKAGGNTMHAIAHVPIEMVKVIQGLVVLFVAAPRVISWLMERTSENKEELGVNPKMALPKLFSSGFGLASVFIGLGTARILLISMGSSIFISIAAMILILVAVNGVLVFIADYSGSPLGPRLELSIAIGWVLAASMVLLGTGLIDLVSYLMGGIAFLIFVIVRLLSQSEEQEVQMQ
ncbi:MAG: ABC transporter permease [Candidatus Thorarchaeota archaeon]